MAKNTPTNIIEQVLGKVRRFIISESLRPVEGRVLLAVSGGVDSVVLTDICQKLATELGLTLFIAHLNHNLRGPDAERDEAFVKLLAKDRGLPCRSQKTDVAGYARSRKMSLEEAARKLRYAFLHQVAAEFKCGSIAVAHHLQDNAESILLNLARGTGLTGLAGIAPKRADGVIRPLLCLQKPEIEAYAQAACLDFVFDRTNDSLDFQRNRVRHVWLPEIQTHFNPQIIAAISRLGQIARTENAWADNLAQEWLSHNRQPLVNGLGLPLIALRTLPKALLYRVLRQAISQVKGDLSRIEYQHLEKIEGLINIKKSLKRLDLPDNLLIVCQGEQLELYQQTQPLRQIKLVEKNEDYTGFLWPGEILDLPQINMHFQCHKIQHKNAFTGVNPLQNHAFFDITKMVMPLCIRNYRQGDTFKPLGFAGRVKIKKFFNQAKIPPHKRKTWPLLVNGNGEILWVVGLRLSAAAAITAENTEFILVEALLS